jgi:hypothetical protein
MFTLILLKQIVLNKQIQNIFRNVDFANSLRWELSKKWYKFLDCFFQIIAFDRLN